MLFDIFLNFITVMLFLCGGMLVLAPILLPLGWILTAWSKTKDKKY